MGSGSALPSEQATLHFAGPADTPLRFAGPPKGLTGTVPLINHGTEKRKIQSIAVKSDRLLGEARQPLREMPFYARLYGGEQASVAAKLVLDPRTPPGTYDLELTMGSKTLAATAYVTEVVDLRANPLGITILAGKATSYTRTFVIENAGNVPLPTGAQCDEPLFEASDLFSSFLVGLAKGDRHSAESMAKGFLREWADLAAGTLTIKREATILEPGEKRTINVEFQLPSSLKPLHHYRTNLQLYNAAQTVDIYTTAAFGPNKAKTKQTGGSQR